MTVEELKQSDKIMLLPADIAEILECNPQQIRVTARTKPELLGFKVSVIGTVTKIPRIPFLEFLGIKQEDFAKR